MIENNFDAMVVIDHDGMIRSPNPAAERLLGKVAAELVGSHFGVPHADVAEQIDETHGEVHRSREQAQRVRATARRDREIAERERREAERNPR